MQKELKKEISTLEKLTEKRIYSIEGNIGAGKTTILKIIGKHFDDVEFVEEPVSQWQNLGGGNLLDSFYSDPTRWGFSFEFYSMFSKIKALYDAANTDKPIIIIERSILSNKVFIDISHEMNKLQACEYKMLMNTFQFYLDHVYPQLAGVIYLDTPVDECVNRIKKRNRGEECSIDTDYLDRIKTKLDELSKSSTIQILNVDGRYDCERDQEKVCSEISQFFHPNHSPKASSVSIVYG